MSSFPINGKKDRGLSRLGKILTYLKNYRRNRDVLRILDEKITFPLLSDYYGICLKYSNDKATTAEQILSQLIIEGHSIEKGMAMKEIRYGFGQKKVKELVSLCNEYLDSYSDNSSRLAYVVGILKEYDDLHVKAGFTLEDTTRQALDSLFAKYPYQFIVPETKETSSERYFENVGASFDRFAVSRHSVRDFTGEPVDEVLMIKAFQLAQQAPSACNRQSVRVYCVYDEALRLRLVELQNHGRGFADKANPLLVITVEMQDWGAGEQWFGGYLDAGIYVMNLLYALHFYRIATIPLNWYADIHGNKQIRKLLSIPESQVPVAFIACGIPLEEFKLVTSLRRDSKETVVFFR